MRARAPGRVHNLFTIIFVKPIDFWVQIWYNIIVIKREENNKMNNQTKETLLALIKGLTKTHGANQFFEGYKSIDENGIKILENFIKNA